MKDKDQILKEINDLNLIRNVGEVQKIRGLVVESKGPKVKIGDLCKIYKKDSYVLAEVVGQHDEYVQLMVLGDNMGIGKGDKVVSTEGKIKVKLGEELLGRVLNGLGDPIDDKGIIKNYETREVYNSSPHPLKRKRITEVMATGIKAIDGFLTVGKGQRLGIFAGSGVGKSTALGMIAKNTSADINVICLVGERGREVREFIEKNLGEEGLKRSIVVVSTSDRPALERIKSVFVAFTIAEYFRDKGKDVLLMMDSITRFAMAQREVGLTTGEPPSTKGYTPSVFALLPQVLERAGTSEKGSITGLITVLVEADDMNEPISDTVRSILDGHIVLDRELASKGHYPAIDVLESVSRVMPDITNQKHLNAAKKMKEVISVYDDAEDLINIGAYEEGSNPKIDIAKNYIDDINDFLTQSVQEEVSFKESVNEMENLYDKIRADEMEG